MSGHQEKSTKDNVQHAKIKLSAKRHAKPAKTPRITKAAITKLGRRAGIPAFSEKSGIFDEVRRVVDFWLDKVVKDAVILAQHGRRKTVQCPDVNYALVMNGRRLYQ